MSDARSMRIVVAGATVVALLAACGASLDDPGTGSSSAGSGSTLKVGLVVPVTGALSAFGEPDQWVADQMTT